ncbi:MAG: hypothetical protein JKX97_07970, partial [Candidatus Lindowbacteria bacterium]|nr:hypothetical protein [Candidatus Lindowbacteria bacterium]
MSLRRLSFTLCAFLVVTVLVMAFVPATAHAAAGDSKPLNLFPDSGTFYTPNPTLTWDTVTGTTGHYIELKLGATFLETATIGAVRTYTWDTKLAASTDSYFWRVYPIGVDTSVAGFSEWASFKINDSTGILILLAPTDESTIDTVTPEFKWDTYTYTTVFYFYLYDDLNNVIMNAGTTTGDTSIKLSQDTQLVPGRTYFWRVKPDVADTWTAEDTFVVAETKPYNLSPTGTNYTPTVMFSWQTIVGETQYYLEMTGGVLPQSETFTVTGTTKDSALTSSGVAYWFRVKPATHFQGAWSDWVTFTQSDTTTTVTTLSPKLGASVETITPTLTWDSIPGATKFFIYLTDTANNIILGQATTTSETSITLTTDTAVDSALTPGRIYQWQVKSDVNDTWSTIDTFVVSDTKPTVLTPTGILYNESVSFTWNAIVTETQYYFQLQGGGLSAAETYLLSTTTKDSTIAASSDSYWYRVKPATHLLAAYTDWISFKVLDSAGILSLITPSKGATVDTITPTFVWDTYTGVNKFFIYLADTANNVILPATTSTAETSITLTIDTSIDSALTPGLTYQWRVKPDVADTWSTLDTFTVNDTRPINLTPKNVSLSDPSISFVWQGIVGETFYHLQLTGGSLQQSETFSITGTNKGDSILAASSDSYQWRVKSVYHDLAAWTDWVTFKVSDSTGLVTLLSPINGDSVNTTTPTLLWDTFADATSFNIFLANLDSSVIIIADTTTTPDTTYTLTDTFNLTPGETYQWRIKPSNGDSWSLVDTFLVAETQPQNLLPMGIVYGQSITFTWDAIASETQYYWAISGGGLAQAETFTVTTTSKDSTLAVHADSYFFRVKAVNHALGGWSPWAEFKVQDSVSLLTLVSPTKGLHIDTTTPELKWDTFTGATSFTIYLTDAESNPIVPTSTTVSGTSFQLMPDTKLEPGRRYFWKIKPNNADSYSVLDSFVVNETTPINLTPAGIIFDPAVTFRWDTIASNTSYYIEISGGALTKNETFTATATQKDSILIASGDSYQFRIKPLTHPLGGWSEWQTFKVSDSTGVLQLVRPINGVTVDTVNPILEWDTFPGAT